MIKKSHNKIVIAIAAASVMAAGSAIAADVEVVATGLHNPRALAFDRDGNLLVAEAGLGGGDDAAGKATGIGITGSISKILHPGSEHPYSYRLITGLASVADAAGAVTGPDGVAVRDGRIYVLETESGGVELQNLLSDAASLTDAQLDAAEQFGKLLEVYRDEDAEQTDRRSRHFKIIAPVGDIDYAWANKNKDAPFAPRGQFPDANPYSVLALDGHQYIADAGSNTIDEVLADGSVRIVAYVPNPPVSDSVPTCVAMGADRNLYVGTLAFGANFALGQGGKSPQSKVYRFDPGASKSVQFLTEKNVWAAGFFPITGCGFGRDGFYVTEYWTSLAPPGGGDVVRVSVNVDGSAGPRLHLGAGVLTMPNGFAAGSGGEIYVSNNSASVQGSVVRIQ